VPLRAAAEAAARAVKVELEDAIAEAAVLAVVAREAAARELALLSQVAALQAEVCSARAAVAESCLDHQVHY